MKSNNDFNVVLRDFINTLGLPLACELDFLSELDSLVLYPLPGGKVERVYMDGSRDVTLIFEIAVKVKNQQVASECLWEINKALGTYDTCTPNGCKFYVPDESLEAYKKAFTSKPYSLRGTSIIRPMSEYHE